MANQYLKRLGQFIVDGKDVRVHDSTSLGDPMTLDSVDLVVMVPVSSHSSPSNRVVGTVRVSGPKVVEKSKFVGIHDIRVWTGPYALPKLNDSFLNDSESIYRCLTWIAVPHTK